MIPLLILPFIMALFPAKYTHQWLLLAAVGWYVLAKLTELWDKAIFAATQGIISGHTMKHLLAAMGCVSILLMLQKRRLLLPPPAV